MLKAIRNRLHLTPATAIAVVALVLASSGGAYAAGKYLITSTKQISPKVLKSLKGAAGAKGVAGAAGSAGPAGAVGGTGPAGSQGPAGPAGPTGKEGPAGKEGKEGPAGASGFTKVLPSKETETGAWSVQKPEIVEGAVVSSISFAIPLAAALDKEHVFFVGAEASVPQCPGTVANPKANVGDLCVYEGPSPSGLAPSENGAIHDPSAESAFAEPGAARTGAVLLFVTQPEESSGLAYGTWAVTAP